MVRPVFAKFDPEAACLDELEPAFGDRGNLRWIEHPQPGIQV